MADKPSQIKPSGGSSAPAKPGSGGSSAPVKGGKGTITKQY